MKTSVSGWVARGLLVVALPVVGLAQEPPRLAVPAREVPIPTTVSPELQKRLAGPIPQPAKVPTTAEEWKKLQRDADTAGEKVASDIARRLEAKVEAAEVGGVKCYRVTPKTVAPENEK